MKNICFTLKELAEKVGAELVGDSTHTVKGLATLQSADSSQLSFLANAAYEKYLSETNAGAVILAPGMAENFAGNKLIHPNPYQAYAELSHVWALYDGSRVEESTIHPSASIDSSVQLGKQIVIGAGVVIEAGARVSDGARIAANCVIGADVIIGEDTVLYSGVQLYHGVVIGDACVIHSGVVIGSDGFGFSPGPRGWTKIAQLGSVVVGNRVEIGANTTIDRGALDDTIIKDGVILDNQIQIAHNVVIGENTAIAACSAIAGSTTVGKNVIVGGASGIAGHLTIADGVHITAMTMVIKSLTEPGVYSSGTGVQPNDKWRKSIARLRQLDKMAGRVSALEKMMKERGES